MMRTLLTLVALLAMAASALAADIAGTWKGTAEGPNGTIERTFTFKVDGATFTGETVSERFGKAPIENGKIDGDSISFTVTLNFQGNEMKMNYTGKLSGDTLTLTAELNFGGEARKIEYKAKKVS